MIASEFVHAGLTGLSTWPAVGTAAVHEAFPGHVPVLADPAGINTTGVLSFILSKIAPILLGILGLIFIARANKGEVSRVLTSSAIAVIGLVFIGGAVTLLFLGSYLINLIFK